MNSIGTVQGWAFGRWAQVARPPAAAPADVPATVGGSARSAFDTLADAVIRSLGGDGAGAGDRSFDGLALALRDALAAGDGSTGAVDGLLKKVSDALGTARSTLIANGLSERDADRAIAGFQSKLADAVESLSAKIQAGSAAPVPAAETPAPAAAPTPDPSASAAAASAFEASWSVDQKLGIRLVTQEGDVVRIRLRQSEGLEAGAAQRGASAYASVSAYTKSRFSIDVQGSLSETEIKAISDVLDQVDRIASAFYSGDAGAAFADAASLSFDPAVLAKVGLKMSQTQSLRISNVVIGPGAAPAPSAVSAPAPSPVPLPSPVPPPSTVDAATASSDANADGTLAPTADSTVAAEPAATTAPGTPASSATAAAATPAAPTVSSVDAVRKSVLDFMRDLLDTLGTTTRAGRVTITARAKLELAVVAIDGARSPSAPSEQAATGLLAGTVANLRDA
jgi:hypothetical protein